MAPSPDEERWIVDRVGARYTATSQGPMDDGLLARGQPSTKQVSVSEAEMSKGKHVT